VIRPTLKADNLMWKGWQAHRRGLATTSKSLELPDTTIQSILRHENVNTTQRFCIKGAQILARAPGDLRLPAFAPFNHIALASQAKG
jgi:hypothetical protein